MNILFCIIGTLCISGILILAFFDIDLITEFFKLIDKIYEKIS